MNGFDWPHSNDLEFKPLIYKEGLSFQVRLLFQELALFLFQECQNYVDYDIFKLFLKDLALIRSVLAVFKNYGEEIQS